MTTRDKLMFGNLQNFLIDIPYKQGLTDLSVVSGFASSAFVRQLLYEYPNMRLRLMIGMAKITGISDADHTTFRELAVKMPDRFDVQYYIGTPGVHAKIYVWSRGKVPELGIITSANLSWSGMLIYKEAGTYADPNQLLAVYDSLRSKALSAISPEVSKYVRIFDAAVASRLLIAATHGAVGNSSEKDLQRVTLSLLTGKGTMHARSGLNWGQREGRNPNQAYIPIPVEVHRRHPGFFPPSGNRFIVKTDDGEILTFVTAQAGNKALETPDDNSSLGSYLRRRLGVPSGELVTLADLKKYGRTDIALVKFDSDLYFLDFSVPIQ